MATLTGIYSYFQNCGLFTSLLVAPVLRVPEEGERSERGPLLEQRKLPQRLPARREHPTDTF